MGVMKPDLVMKSIIPVVMAGVLGIYGLIIAVIIANQGARPPTLARPYAPFCADCTSHTFRKPVLPVDLWYETIVTMVRAWANAGRLEARGLARDTRTPGRQRPSPSLLPSGCTVPVVSRAAVCRSLTPPPLPPPTVAPPTGGITQYSSFTGYAHLAAGLACGLSGMAAGIAIGIVGDAGVRASAQQAKLYVGMVLILIFAEALGLYGLIVGLILTSKESKCT